MTEASARGTLRRMTIAPIPTKYAGYHFRSRLEARWAVFFDALRIQWEYEPEGFALPSGAYLPDFRVTSPAIEGEHPTYWVEIKGTEPADMEKAHMSELSAASGRVCMLFVGDPLNHTCYRFGKTGWVHEPETELTTLYFDMWSFLGFKGTPEDWIEPVQKAGKAARSARFEHGQSGATA